MIFQQDNAPPHTAKYTKEMKVMDVSVSSWPPLSSDLNLIENVWAILKRAVRKRHPSYIDSLREKIQTQWTRVVTKELCKRLFISIKEKYYFIEEV